MFEHTDDILNIEQFCELLDIGKSTGYKLLKSGTVKGFKIGKVWKIPTQSIEDFVLRETKCTGSQKLDYPILPVFSR